MISIATLKRTTHPKPHRNGKQVIRISTNTFPAHSYTQHTYHTSEHTQHTSDTYPARTLHTPIAYTLLHRSRRVSMRVYIYTYFTHSLYDYKLKVNSGCPSLIAMFQTYTSNEQGVEEQDHCACGHIRHLILRASCHNAHISMSVCYARCSARCRTVNRFAAIITTVFTLIKIRVRV